MTEAVVSAIKPRPAAIPDALRAALAPATHTIYEWREYWLAWPDATGVRIGSDWAEPVVPGIFRVVFANKLGLTYLQPFRDGRPLVEPLRVEVISPKFPEPETHYRFFSTLLDDLFARAARLPFHFAGPTSRGAGESLQPPSPLFVYHFLLQHGPQLRQALEIVRAAPHRVLIDQPTYLPIGQVSEADPAILIDIMHSPHRWAPAHGFRLAERLNGFAPAHVWQRLSEETLDTPENRFVLAFLRQLRTAAETLPSERWWNKVSSDRVQAITELTGLIRQTLASSMFHEVGVMERMPLSSQVLRRQEGYRELRDLYWQFHQARRPLFEQLKHSIEVRDIATLYEQWSFFALTEEIAVQVGVTPRIELVATDEHGLNWHAAAHFQNTGKLIYNQGRKGYSVPLRPDFAWVRNGDWDVVLDAKFRLNRQQFDGDGDMQVKAIAQQSDLYKMHTYRDALGVRAAVSVYPGDVSVFYDRNTGQRQHGVTLAEILLSERAGIGALAFSPLSGDRNHLHEG